MQREIGQAERGKYVCIYACVYKHKRAHGAGTQDASAVYKDIEKRYDLHWLLF